MQPDSKGTAVVRRFVFAVWLPMAAVFGLVICWIDLGPDLLAARGDGTPGVWQVTSRNCDETWEVRAHLGRKKCLVEGTFVSDDGSLVRTGVGYLDGAHDAKVGDRLLALDTGNRGGVYKPSGSHEWILNLSLMAMAVGCLVWSLWRYALPALLRRRSPLARQLSTAPGLTDQ